jgi:hypothetical protein
VSSLQNACGEYGSFANALTNNANQYITRVDAIIKKLSQGR